ncbi:uncharacterized protein LOC106869880 [Octopus bimaculoides]|uniref:Uncharacterized protein n=1 Tax=Octopus bimaculoides TaxID=37653 RepID=A0A0L8HLT8_OCTBM|nr:uncharacterized protein LOC106869880 [Octopus bimaculoides]|eukprot:XP_014771289.1 PREDICTED: uncharacterized protein LOC106869880 [Octopus bimaculoides]
MKELKPTSNNRNFSRKMVGLRSKDIAVKQNYKDTKYEHFYTIRTNNLLLDISQVALSKSSTENLQIPQSSYKKFWIQEKSISNLKLTNKTPTSFTESKCDTTENNGIQDYKASIHLQANSDKTNINNSDILITKSKAFKSRFHQSVLDSPTFIYSSIHGFMPYQDRLKTTMGKIYQKKITESQRHLNFDSYKDLLSKLNNHNSMRDSRNALNTKRIASFSPRTLQKCMWNQPLKTLSVNKDTASVPKSLTQNGSSLKQNINSIKYNKMEILPLATPRPECVSSSFARKILGN